MNTNTPTDQALLRANLLGFVTQVKAAAAAEGKELTDAAVGSMHKRATSHLQANQAKQAKIREIVLSHIRPAGLAAAAPAA